jgi:penicillin-binding protein A
MNKPIRTLAVGCLVLFALLMINVNYIQVFKAGDFNSASSNKRARDAECARDRGPILVGGDPIARSVRSHDELKYLRTYRHPRLYAPVTGFFSCIYGTSGIESSQNSILSGSDEQFFVNRVMGLVGNEQPQGGSVLLTLNAAAQRAALRGLQSLSGTTEGAVVALDPTTGAILAMVSTPTYDPNSLATHDVATANRNWKQLNAGAGKKMLNRATQEIYPPGSTFKMVVSAAALSNGYSPGSTVKGGYSLDLPLSSNEIHNENLGNCGGSELTLTQALAISCNVSFADLGLKLGAKTLQAQAEQFGFNEDYLDELPLAASRFPSGIDAPQTALSAIGQFEVAATPMQMALVTAGIANGGAVMKPYVVQEIRSPDLDVLDQAQPEVLHQALSPSAASGLTQMMVQVVETGTGHNAQIPGISVAGKTGTANSSAARSPYAWMTAFAPANDPQVAVAVLVAHTDVAREDISGGGLAGPIARQVMEAVISR